VRFDLSFSQSILDVIQCRFDFLRFFARIVFDLFPQLDKESLLIFQDLR